MPNSMAESAELADVQGGTDDRNVKIDKVGVKKTIFVQTQHDVAENRWVLDATAECGLEMEETTANGWGGTAEPTAFALHGGHFAVGAHSRAIGS